MLNAAPANSANQLGGDCYDAAGNFLQNGTCPTGSFTPTYYYDQENRLYNPQATYTYFYDADSVRIRKAASSTVGTFYWPGANGEILTEANGSGTINEEYIYFNGQRIARVDQPTGTVHYYFSDQLGSASVVTNATGGGATYDYYYPFGGLVASSGSDPNHYLFTGKERDNDSGEFGLDYFGARHYGSMIGRFMTPDWSGKPTAVPYAVLGDPQTLNLYSYVENSPLDRIDADGHFSFPLANIECEFDTACFEHVGCVFCDGPPQKPWPNANSKSGFWSGLGQRFGNLFKGKGFHTNQQLLPEGTVTTNEIDWLPGEGEPNGWVTAVADSMGVAAAVTKNTPLGIASSAVSIANDRSKLNVALTVGSSVLPYVVEGSDVPLAFGFAAHDGSQFAGKVMTDVFTPDALQSDQISDGNGHLIPNPQAAFDSGQAFGPN